ncbi:MAG: flagellar basal body L-ring protein FlgH [Phycisphaerales bacterium]|nr:flagellar basal body L-ring protein FlgH [Phycisphaerales bacterium]
MHTGPIVTAAVLVLCGGAAGQSLFLLPPEPAIVGDGAADPAAGLYGYSLIAVQPPRPKSFKVHDLVTIIVNQSSSQEAEQKLKTDKKYNLSADVGPLLDFLQLLELRLQAGDSSDVALANAQQASKFDGKGTFERTDKFSAKLQAEIIDVKPNGTLVLEARTHVAMGREVQTMVLSGKCRLEDVTDANTVMSYQLADLNLMTTHEGQVDKAGKKGVIPRVLETLFSF